MNKPLVIGQDVQHYDITVSGRVVHYGAKRLTETLINIGTYYELP